MAAILFTGRSVNNQALVDRIPKLQLYDMKNYEAPLYTIYIVPH